MSLASPFAPHVLDDPCVACGRRLGDHFGPSVSKRSAGRWLGCFGTRLVNQSLQLSAQHHGQALRPFQVVRGGRDGQRQGGIR